MKRTIFFSDQMLKEAFKEGRRARMKLSGMGKPDDSYTMTEGDWVFMKAVADYLSKKGEAK